MIEQPKRIFFTSFEQQSKQILKCNQILEPMNYQHEFKQQIYNEITNRIQSSNNYLLKINQYNTITQDMSVSRRKNKNSKKKQRKKRNKLNKFKIQEQNIEILKGILAKIYANIQTFQSQKPQIIHVINQIKQQQIFFQILNHAINQYIDVKKQVIQRSGQSIWYRLDEYINADPQDFLQKCPDLDESPEFFKLLIDELYNEYEIIKQASNEVQKIIEAFISQYCNKPQNQQQKYNLNKNTFNHLISSNIFFEKFMKSSQNFLAIPTALDQTINKQYMQKLQYLLTIYKPSSNQDDQEYDEDQQACFDSENSTQEEFNIKQNDNQGQNKQARRKKKKNKRKEKSKQQNLDVQYMICQCQEQQTHIDRMIQQFEKMSLSKNRITCQVSQEWISQIQQIYLGNKGYT